MLLREGQYVPLTPKALETLVVLVEHVGRIVEKEELHRQVWPDTAVEDASLAKNVSTLRKTLGESASQRYIETVPKRGYRFVAEVRVLEPPDAASVPNLADLRGSLPRHELRANGAGAGQTRTRFRRVRLWWLLALSAAATAGLAYWLAASGARSRQHLPSLKTAPLTSFPGHQDQAAFSPDGSQIAFVWDGPQHDRVHVYAKLIGSETLLQLTNGAAAESKPAWSPDGRSIAFLRTSGDRRGWYLISALGGAERKLADVLPYFDLGSGNSPYYSPDGRYLAIVDKNSPAEPASIFRLSLTNSERLQLTSPPAGTTGDYYPAFSPDGKQLAFARADSFSATDLYVLPLSGNKQPRRLTFDGLTIDGLTWTSDSREIIFSSRRGGSINSLWRIAATGGAPERVSSVGEDIGSPAMARNSNRLAYTRTLDDMNIWSIALDASGHATSETPLIASTFRDSDPDYSPDGRKIAFTSGRAGGFGIWVSNSDGSDPRLLFDGGPYVTGSPRWSPDGRWIAFDSRSNNPVNVGSPNIWVISAEGGQARRLTTDAAGGVAPSWSHDGRWIYFASARGGNLNVWKMPAGGGSAVPVTRKGGFEGFESADGQYVYYLKGREIPGIWRVPTAGGEEVPVTDRDQAGLWRCWRLAGGGIYYGTAAPPDGARLEFLDLATGRVREIGRTKPPDLTIPSLAVSPDGRRLLYAQYDQSGSNIMMVEGFR
ncbi:MAG: winged helix-turn-helix domain-containing protein [Bryobacteraceae bacterium]